METHQDQAPRFVRSRQLLAEQIGVNRNTINSWVKKEGAPEETEEGHDVAAWLTFARAISRKAVVSETNEKRSLELQKIEQEIRGKMLANDAMEKRLVPVAEIRETITACVAEFRGFMRNIKETLPQALDGLDIPGRREVISKMFDEMEKKIHTGRLAKIK